MGATGGIGQAIAKQLHKSGMNLILVGRNQKTLEALSLQLKTGAGKGDIYQCKCDISDEKNRRDLATFIKSLPHVIDIMINNSGINDFALFEEQTDETISELLQVNALYPLLLIKQLLPYFSKQSVSVQVINVGSIFGSIAYPGFAAYSASKFALRGATEALGREYADTNIHFRYFAPRATQTSLNTDAVIQMNKELKSSMDTAEKVAKEFAVFIKSKKTIQYLGWPERFFVWINQIMPRLVSREIKKMLPVIRKYAETD